MRRPDVLLGIALAAAVLGCSNGASDPEEATPLTEVLCTEELRAAVAVEVRDMATGEPAACGATGEVRDGSFLEPLSDMGSCASAPATTVYLTGPWERAGTYTVTIRKPGYQDWVRSQVVVMADECHVHTVTLQALLEHS